MKRIIFVGCLFMCAALSTYAGTEFSLERNGPEAGPQFPHLVFLSIRKYLSLKEETHCVGSVISKKWILTAATCVRPLAYSIYVFPDYADLNNATGKPINLTIDKIFHPKEYFPSIGGMIARNDIAIIRVKEGDLENLANYTSQDQKLPSSKLVTAGFGQKGESVVSKKLRWSEVKIVSEAECNIYHFFNKNTMICAMAKTHSTGPCYNDIGSPLMYLPNLNVTNPSDEADVDGLIIGVISAVSLECDQPFVATNVAKFSDWITRNSQ